MTASPSDAPLPPSPGARAKRGARPRSTPVHTPPATPRRSVKRRPVPSSPSSAAPARPRKRARDARQRAPKRGAGAASSGQSVLTLFRHPFLPDVKLVSPTARLFAQEFGCLLFAFGDGRFCVRETLELVEDCVRDEVRRVASSGLRAVVSRMDTRAKYRLNDFLSLYRRHADPSAHDSSTVPDASTNPDLLAMWTDKLFLLLKHWIPLSDYKYLLQCRSITFAMHDSISLDPTTRGTPRAALFKQWLAVPFSDQYLPTLAHLTWELTGQLVQTALLCKYNHDFHSHDSHSPSLNYFPNMWTNERHLLEALGHGTTTALTVPCSDVHASMLVAEIQRFIQRPYSTRFYMRYKSESLIPAHIYAALNKLKEKGWGGHVQLRAGLFQLV